MEFKLNEYHRNVSDEELLKDILRVAKSINKETITRKEYMENGGKYHNSTICKRFGSWIKALTMCGLKPSQQQVYSSSGTYTQSNISTQELIDDLIRVSKEIDKTTFTSGEYNEHGKFSSATYFKRFKTWNNALKAAGLIPFEVPSGKRISEYGLLEEIERIWIKLGRQPTTTDIKNGVSKYSLHAFERRFGTWRKALEFFVSYINGEQEVEKPVENNDVILPNDIQQRIAKADQIHKTKRDINLRLRFKVMQRDNFKCCMCGASPATDPTVILHIDHIIPWAKGGETTIDNLQTLCSKCNLGKSDLL
ncbi:MAG: HNH endonuclease [Ruminococcaceae bacterium]|nr:HNH endonuclease [Oscillospiraceae bacterium]